MLAYMKTMFRFAATAIVSIFSLQSSSLLCAATTIDAVNNFAYGAEHRLDGCAATPTTARSSANTSAPATSIPPTPAGSISAAAPANGIYYQNLASNDFGVNQDGLGNLRGYAWGEHRLDQF